MASRFNVISPLRLARNAINPATRQVAYIQAREGFRALSVMGATLGLLDLVPGVDVGWNPAGPEFGKVRVGKAVYDLTGGMAHTVSYLSQMAQSFYDIERGKKPKAHKTPLALTAHYLRSQLSPSASVAVDAEQGETYTGQPFEWSNVPADLLLPMSVADLYAGWKAEGGASATDLAAHDWYPDAPNTGFKGALEALPGAFGAGVQFYDKKESYERPPDERNLLAESDTPAARELKRLHVDVPMLKNPSTEVSNGEHAGINPSDNTASFNVAEVEAARRVYYDELSQAVESVVSDPAYQSFTSDGARAHYLEQVLKGARARALNAIRLKLRTNQVDETEKVKAMQERLLHRSPSVEKRGTPVSQMSEDAVRQAARDAGKDEDVAVQMWRAALSKIDR
jgi:hypothetical protein